MTMVGIVLTPVGGIALWIRVVGLLRPSDSISHTFYDGYNLHGLKIKALLWDTSAVDMRRRLLPCPHG